MGVTQRKTPLVKSTLINKVSLKRKLILQNNKCFNPNSNQSKR